MRVQAIDCPGGLIIKKILETGDVIYGYFTKKLEFKKRVKAKQWNRAVYSEGGIIENKHLDADPFPSEST